MQFSLGSDPELFIQDNTGKLKSAIRIIPEEKEHPRAIDKHGSAILHDNVLAEFNTIPADTEDDFVQNVRKALSGLNKVITNKKAEIREKILKQSGFRYKKEKTKKLPKF